MLAEDYPVEFEKSFGKPDAASFAKAIDQGRHIYIAEACWHCHFRSSSVRSRTGTCASGPVSQPGEYQNEMMLPHSSARGASDRI